MVYLGYGAVGELRDIAQIDRVSCETRYGQAVMRHPHCASDGLSARIPFARVDSRDKGHIHIGVPDESESDGELLRVLWVAVHLRHVSVPEVEHGGCVDLAVVLGNYLPDRLSVQNERCRVFCKGWPVVCVSEFCVYHILE